MPDDAPDRGLLQTIKGLLDDIGLWFEEHLGGSEESKRVLEELGLPAGGTLSQEQRDALAESRQNAEATIDDVIMLGETILAICRGIENDNLRAVDVFQVVAQTVAARQVERHAPRIAAVARALGIITDDPEEVRQFAFTNFFAALTGEPNEKSLADWIMPLAGVLCFLLEEPAKEEGIELVGYYGWDPEPDSATPRADVAASRALTIITSAVEHPGADLAVTLLPVPDADELGGAVLVSLGGGITIEKDFKAAGALRVHAAIAGGLNVLLTQNPESFKVGGTPDGTLDIRWTTPATSPWRIGSTTGTRLEILRTSIGVEVNQERARLRLGIEEGNLVITFNDADGLLQNLAGAEIRSPLTGALVVDSATGVHLEGGTRLTVRLPTAVAAFPGCTLHYLELSLGKGPWPTSIETSIAAGLSFRLGGFAASIDRVGLSLALSLPDEDDAVQPKHRIGGLGYDVGFLPPKGLGLSLECGPIKGGGYLWFDPGAGEYAGVLELKLEAVQLKALALINTKVPLPNGKTTWSILLLIFAEWTEGIPIYGGLFLDGVGGMLGVNHGADIPALEGGLRQGILDDITFPADPVADAPRIIPRLRTVFPTSVQSVTLGPFIKLGYMVPRIASARLGIIAQLDNVLPGGAPFRLARVMLFGTVSVVKPEPPHKAHVSIKADILGYIDFVEKRLSFFSQLRDSKIGGITLTGSFLLRIDWGESRAFLMAFGGFHPDYKDLPPGLPTPIDRLGVAPIKRGGFTIEANGYLAVTSNSFQIGFGGSAKAKLGPVSLEGKLKVDGLFTGDAFLLAALITARVKYKGHSLAGVEIDAKLRGPGYWRFWGKVTFEILWWDVSKSFDVDWGDEDAPAPSRTTEVVLLMQSALTERGNWKAALPAGADGLVTLATTQVPDAVAAHPLAALEFAQNVAPFNLALDRFGDTAVQGPRQFDAGALKVGSRTIDQPTVITTSFARGQFLDLTDAEKLSTASFEPMPAGVAVGSPDFSIGMPVGGDLDFETFYLDPQMGPNQVPKRSKLTLEARALSALPVGTLGWQSSIGAAARSKMRPTAIGSGEAARLTVAPPPLVVIDAGTLNLPPQPVELDRGAVRATALARQLVGARADRSSLRVVEIHEME